ASAKAGTATWTTPIAAPNASSTANTVRIPLACSGPSQPTSWPSPRQRRDPPVPANPGAGTEAPVPATTPATVGENTATIPATSAGAVTTAISNTTATSAYAVARCSGSSTSEFHSERIDAGSCGTVIPPQAAIAHSAHAPAPACAA